MALALRERIQERVNIICSEGQSGKHYLFKYIDAVIEFAVLGVDFEEHTENSRVVITELRGVGEIIKVVGISGKDKI